MIGLPHSDFIALRVQGESMNRISPDGSIIFVDLRDRELVNGRLYVFRSNDSATYKAYVRTDKGVYLAPRTTDPDHEIIIPEGEIEVVGRVVRTMLDL